METDFQRDFIPHLVLHLVQFRYFRFIPECQTALEPVHLHDFAKGLFCRLD
jgi:hypothetical protein